MNSSEMFRLDGQIAVVTGGGQGLGKAMAIALAEAGADIVIAEIIPDRAEDVVDEIRRIGRKASVIETDVSDVQSVENMTHKAISEFSQIDILVNNVGVVYKSQVNDGDTSIPMEEVNPDNWKHVLKINITGTFNCSQSVGRCMIQRKTGKIINIASMSGVIANWGRFNNAYCTSKGAVIMFTKELATEWADKGIRVNAIAPGYMVTEGAKALKDPKVREHIEIMTPLRRLGVPDDLKGLAIFLASDASAFITGQTIVIDGGYTLW